MFLTDEAYDNFNIKEFVWKKYGIICETCEWISDGVDSLSFLVKTKTKNYVLKKYQSKNAEKPKLETNIASYLIKAGVKTSLFIKGKNQSDIQEDDKNCFYTLQEYFSGEVKNYHEADSALLIEMANLLGKIHQALKDYSYPLKEGIGRNFFLYMTLDKARLSYRRSLEYARENHLKEDEEDLRFRLHLIENERVFDFNLEHLSMVKTHGDYGIKNLITKEDSIVAVIDFASAVIHPSIWEILRSYLYASMKTTEGNIDFEELVSYLKAYLNNYSLNEYDIDCFFDLFYYQSLVANYYEQYYCSKHKNRELFHEQAVFTTKVLKFLDPKLDVLRQELRKALKDEINTKN